MGKVEPPIQNKETPAKIVLNSFILKGLCYKAGRKGVWQPRQEQAQLGLCGFWAIFEYPPKSPYEKAY